METNEQNWHGATQNNFIDYLLQRRSNVNLIRLILFSRIIKQNRPECPEVNNFINSVQWMNNASPGAIANIMRTPWFDHWAYLADNIRNRYERGEMICDEDLPSYEYFDTTTVDRVGWFLRDFQRFMLELAILTKTDYENFIPVWDNHINFGFWGVSIEVKNKSKYQFCKLILSKNKIKLKINKKLWNVTCLHQGFSEQIINQSFVVFSPRIKYLNSEIIVSDSDPLLRREWVNSYINPDGTKYLPPPKDLSNFCDNYQKALGTIFSCWPSMAFDILNGLHTIIPVGRPALDKAVSCSSDSFFGAILCCNNEPLLAAEVLIHEFGHNVFNEMLSRDEVFEEQPSPSCVIYSPWREDPRPVIGCFHGAFVFERVCSFYEKYINNGGQDNFIASRFRVLVACVRIACYLIKQTHTCGVLGNIILDKIEKNVNDMALKPIGKLNDAERFAILNHFQNWCERNPDLIKKNEFKINL
jgi:hypothetical protein